MELRNRVQQLNLIGLCNCVTWVLGIFTQEYRGHVTIWPVPSVRDYINIISNPSEDDIQRCIKKGQNRTFPKINMLKSIMAIEVDFDDCCSLLKKNIKESRVLSSAELLETIDENSNICPGFSIIQN